jgi:hypothetical protein
MARAILGDFSKTLGFRPVLGVHISFWFFSEPSLPLL